MHPDTARHVRTALPSLRVSWSLMVAASLGWAVLGLIASPVVTPADTPATRWSMALAAFGMLSAVVTLWVDRAVITPGRMAELIPVFDYALVQRHLLAGHLVLWSLAELPSLFGFAQLFLDGTLGVHLGLCALSLLTLTLLMPTRRRVGVRMEAVLH